MDTTYKLEPLTLPIPGSPYLYVTRSRRIGNFLSSMEAGTSSASALFNFLRDPVRQRSFLVLLRVLVIILVFFVGVEIPDNVYGECEFLHDPTAWRILWKATRPIYN